MSRLGHTDANGDECACISLTTSGAPGQFYNQVINGHHYLTQKDSATAACSTAAVGACRASGSGRDVIASLP
jgi:hypothetical protein